MPKLSAVAARALLIGGALLLLSSHHAAAECAPPQELISRWKTAWRGLSGTSLAAAIESALVEHPAECLAPSEVQLYLFESGLRSSLPVGASFRFAENALRSSTDQRTAALGICAAVWDNQQDEVATSLVELAREYSAAHDLKLGLARLYYTHQRAVDSEDWLNDYYQTEQPILHVALLNQVTDHAYLTRLKRSFGLRANERAARQASLSQIIEGRIALQPPTIGQFVDLALLVSAGANWEESNGYLLAGQLAHPNSPLLLFAGNHLSNLTGTITRQWKHNLTLVEKSPDWLPGYSLGNFPLLQAQRQGEAWQHFAAAAERLPEQIPPLARFQAAVSLGRWEELAAFEQPTADLQALTGISPEDAALAHALRYLGSGQLDLASQAGKWAPAEIARRTAGIAAFASGNSSRFEALVSLSEQEEPRGTLFSWPSEREFLPYIGRFREAYRGTIRSLRGMGRAPHLAHPLFQLALRTGDLEPVEGLLRDTRLGNRLLPDSLLITTKFALMSGDMATARQALSLAQSREPERALFPHVMMLLASTTEQAGEFGFIEPLRNLSREPWAGVWLAEAAGAIPPDPASEELRREFSLAMQWFPDRVWWRVLYLHLYPEAKLPESIVPPPYTFTSLEQGLPGIGTSPQTGALRDFARAAYEKGRQTEARLALGLLVAELILWEVEKDFHHQPIKVSKKRFGYAASLALEFGDTAALRSLAWLARQSATGHEYTMLALFEAEGYRLERRAGEALELLERLDFRRSNWPSAYYLAALCYADLGQVEQAQAALRQGMTIEPSDPAMTRLAAYVTARTPEQLRQEAPANPDWQAGWLVHSPAESPLPTGQRVLYLAGGRSAFCNSCHLSGPEYQAFSIGGPSQPYPLFTRKEFPILIRRALVKGKE